MQVINIASILPPYKYIYIKIYTCVCAFLEANICSTICFCQFNESYAKIKWHHMSFLYIYIWMNIDIYLYARSNPQWYHWWSQVRAMVSHGFLRLLGDLQRLEGYWNQLLRDFPEHPARGKETRSIPLTLYGAPSQKKSFTIFYYVWVCH